MPDSIQPGARDFCTTRWSLVRGARGDTQDAQRALGALCGAYWYPLYAFVRRQGHQAHDAQDLTQEFFARLISKDWLEGLEPERGKFRAWLLAAMKHFLCNEWDRAHAEKRGGGQVLLSIDETTAESRYLREPVAVDDAELLYDRRWALTLLERVMARLREEFSRAGKAKLFDAIKGTLTGDAPSHAEIAARLDSTEGAVKIAVHRLRERYRVAIREEIAETVDGAAEIEEELRHLLAVLSH